MNKNIPTILLILIIFIISVSCTKSLIYNTKQKDILWFQPANQLVIKSFSLLKGDSLDVNLKLMVMGKIYNNDKPINLEYVPVEKNNRISIGNKTYHVIDAMPNIEYILKPTILKSKKNIANIAITLLRSKNLNDSTIARLKLRVIENENFKAIKLDTSKKTNLLSPYYTIYIHDGEVSCPSWWKRPLDKELGYTPYLGNFSPEKYRRFLDLFHKTKTSLPRFYNYIVERLGENLNEPNLKYSTSRKTNKEDQAKDMLTLFWIKNYPKVWANYVIIPLYDYYHDYFKSHPNSPLREPMGDDPDSSPGFRPTDKGWADPRKGILSL